MVPSVRIKPIYTNIRRKGDAGEQVPALDFFLEGCVEVSAVPLGLQDVKVFPLKLSQHFLHELLGEVAFRVVANFSVWIWLFAVRWNYKIN